jgi:hypothetical protein
MTDASALLAQYRPFVRYDSLESYHTDSAGVITDHPGNSLKRLDGTVLASATAGAPSEGVAVLTLDFLRPDRYPTGDAALATDYVDLSGQDYVPAALQMHATAGYANKAHGRVAQQDGVTWLQYWFFMYYDNPGLFDSGTHEGDLEMIQLRLDADGRPQEVSYAQHRTGVRAPWSFVEQQKGAPVVYSARGSHASMLRAGTVISDRSFLPDHNDGRGPRVRLELVELSPELTPWAFWPGVWGGTRPPNQDLGKIGVEANSPVAPTRHLPWRDPERFHESCDRDELPPLGRMHVADLHVPPQPRIDLIPHPERGVLSIKYEIPEAGQTTPSGLVIGVRRADHRGPAASTLIRNPGASGEIEVPLDAGPMEVRAATHSKEGAVSETTAVPAGDAKSRA